MGLLLGFTAPATAVDMVSYFGSSASCAFKAEATTYTAKATNLGCYKVQAKITYRNSSGTLVTVIGGQGSTSTATATTTMVTDRAGRGSINVNNSVIWATYGSF